MTRSPTLRQVAERTGVSPQTVSNAVVAPERVAAPTLARIRRAFDELGFVPNAAARALRGRTTAFLGLTVPALDTPWRRTLAHHIDTRAAESGVLVQIRCTGGTDDEAADVRRFHAMGAAGALSLRGRDERLRSGLHRATGAWPHVLIVSDPESHLTGSDAQKLAFDALALIGPVTSPTGPPALSERRDRDLARSGG